MPLGKQAKTLSADQIGLVERLVQSTRWPVRNRVILLLSARAGLRAHEIAHLSWSMVLDASKLISDSLRLEDRASKGMSGRVVPMSSELRNAIEAWRSEQAPGATFVISTERSSRTVAQVIVNMFFRWYSDLGFVGCSSHSGRRTFITNAARKISTVGGSIRDVQMLAGHSDLRTTQRYIEANADAQRRVVELI
jgi:integrase/recombinase XerD